MLKRKKSFIEDEECEIVKAFIDLTLEPQNNDGKKQLPLDALLDGRRTTRVEQLDVHLEIRQEKPMDDAELANAAKLHDAEDVHLEIRQEKPMDDAELANAAKLHDAELAKLARKRHLEWKAAFQREQAENKRRRMEAERAQALIMQRHMQKLEENILHYLVDDTTVYQYWCWFQANIFRERRQKHRFGTWGEHVAWLDEDERWNAGSFLASVQHEYMAGCCKNCFNNMAFKDLGERHERSSRGPMVLRSTKLFFKDLDERRERKRRWPGPVAPRQPWLTCAEFGTWTWL